MQTRTNTENSFEQLADFAKRFTFDRFNIYQLYGDTVTKAAIDQAAALVDRLTNSQAEIAKEYEAVCAEVSRKIGIYYAFCESDHVKAAKYFCNHRTVHELRTKVLENKEEIIAQHGSLENFSKKEVECADSYTLILYGQTHDGDEHGQLLHYLESHLQEYERLEKSEAHLAQHTEIDLSKALILDCLAVKYLQITSPTPDDLEKTASYLNAATTIQKKYMSSDQLSIAELAYSYYLFSVLSQKKNDIEDAVSQANFAIQLHEQLHKITNHFNLKEFDIRQHHADLLRQLNRHQASKVALLKIITDQTQFYAPNSHPTIAKSYHYLARTCEAMREFSNAHLALKNAWTLEVNLHLPSADQTKAEMKRILKIQKIVERVEALKNLPTYNWCSYLTLKDYEKEFLTIGSLIGKLILDKDFLNAEQKSFLADQCYVMGSYYNHAKGIPANALECLNAAEKIIAPGYPAIWLQLQIAYQTQFTLSKVKRDNSINAAGKIAIGVDTAKKCHAILFSCANACSAIPQPQADSLEVNKMFLFSQYIAALLQIQLVEINPAPQSQHHYEAAMENLLRGLQANKFNNLENDLVLKVKALYAYTLTMMEHPPVDPKPIYEELEQFLARDPALTHPEGAKIFVHYAKELKKDYKKDKTKIALLNAVLDKYQKARTSLIINGKENSPLEMEITKFIEHLEHKIQRGAGSSNYSPSLFSPVLAPVDSSSHVMDTTFSLSSLSSQPVQRP
jgi:hypothetical protein